MARESDAIYNAAVRGGINPAFVAGLAAAESSYGTAGYARGTYNPFGLGVHLGWRFPNYASATSKLAKTLNEARTRASTRTVASRGSSRATRRQATATTRGSTSATSCPTDRRQEVTPARCTSHKG